MDDIQEHVQDPIRRALDDESMDALNLCFAAVGKEVRDEACSKVCRTKYDCCMCHIACVVWCMMLLLSKDSHVTLDAPTRQICEQQASPHKKEDTSTGSPCRIWQGDVCMTSYYDAQGRCTLSSTGGLHTMLIVSSIVTFVAGCLGILVYRVSSRPLV